MKLLLKYYQYLNILSLDVAFGAWAGGNMAIILLGVKMPFAWQWSLPLSVWVIYTADHLLDAFNLKEKAETRRHSFHVRNFRTVSTVWILCLGVCVFLLPFLLPLEAVLSGVLLGCVSLIHFTGIHFIGKSRSVLFLKEWGVGTIYTAGIWGIPVIMKYNDYGSVFPGNHLGVQQLMMDYIPDVLLLGICFYLNVMLSVLLFSIWEMDADIRQQQNSWVLSLGRKKSILVVKSLMTISLITGLGLIFTVSKEYPERIWASVILTAMSLSHILLWKYSAQLKKNDYYRLLGEAVFFLPSFIILIV